MRVLVTGSAGFIGAHLCETLTEGSSVVVGVDNFDPFYSEQIKKDNLQLLKQRTNFHFYEADIRDQGFLEKMIQQHQIEMVVHLAAKAGVRPSIDDPRGYLSTNVDGTLSLLEAARKCGVKKIVFASSSSVYGKNEKVPFAESDHLEQVISPYAASKLAGENFTRLYHNLYDFSVINLRFFTVYGPRQRPDLAIHKFMKALIKRETITVYGDGSMARDYTYIKDTIQGIQGAMKLLKSASTIYETYNLGHSTPVTLIELLTNIEKISGLKFEKTYAPVPLGDVPQTFAAIAKAKRDLGYSPSYPLALGLKSMWDWIFPLYSK